MKKLRRLASMMIVLLIVVVIALGSIATAVAYDHYPEHEVEELFDILPGRPGLY